MTNQPNVSLASPNEIDNQASYHAPWKERLEGFYEATCQAEYRALDDSMHFEEDYLKIMDHKPGETVELVHRPNIYYPGKSFVMGHGDAPSRLISFEYDLFKQGVVKQEYWVEPGKDPERLVVRYRTTLEQDDRHPQESIEESAGVVSGGAALRVRYDFGLRTRPLDSQESPIVFLNRWERVKVACSLALTDALRRD